MRLSGVPNSGAWAYVARLLLSGKAPEGVALPAVSGPLVLVRAGQAEIEDVADAYAALGPLFGDSKGAAALLGEDGRVRLAGLARLRQGARLALATPEALKEPAPARMEFETRSVTFRRGARLGRDEALARLIEAGYKRVEYVESPGEAAVRGAVLDFYGLEPLRAVRLLFNEDEIESLRTFDPSTQSTDEFIEEAAAVCASSSSGQPLERWFGEDAAWLVENRQWAPAGAEARAAWVGGPEDGAADAGLRPLPPWAGKLAAAWEDMARWAAEGWTTAVFSLNHGEDHRVQELAEGRAPAGACQFLIGPIREGFLYPAGKLAVVTTSDLFARRYRQPSRWRLAPKAGRAAARVAQLKRGDFVVHQDYGVARYAGLQTLEASGHGMTECVSLEFRGTDRLYVALSEFGRIQKYSSADGHRPRLSALDSRKWEEIKAQVKEGVRELAEQILKLEAKRRAAPGFAFPPESAMEREFAESFPYEETPDQARAIAEVLGDMTAPHPMDRLVVGDVGFGKTEVAMRAVMKCAMGLKQAAILAPTTVLADQHYRTFASRFAEYPVKIGALTRFQTDKEQAETLKALKEGKLDAVVGTSRLLQKDVRFRDLGLIVVDEEHRFGVQDKEKLKRLRHNADCLALSATPIPRSLHQAFSGLRSLSLIESAPEGREPVETRVLPWDEAAAAAAIEAELGRGGQVFYVHNRVRTLPDVLKKLQGLLPQARLASAHGQMPALALEKVMWEFFNRRYDVLVASTIIESGLDLPSANTMIVEDAHEFGLAQLYQLRGRIGRERSKAHCLLFYPKDADYASLSEEARKRLDALREFGQLGAGIKLAMRDLEIRGAGDLLGAKQHGFVNAVGVDFYSELLHEELAKVKGGEAERQREVAFDIDVAAYLPDAYIPGETERIEFYKRLLKARVSELKALERELADLAGPPPPPAQRLFELVRLRAAARARGVAAVVQQRDALEITFAPDAEVGPGDIAAWTARYKKEIGFMRGEGGDGVRLALAGRPPLERLTGFLGEAPAKNDI